MNDTHPQIAEQFVNLMMGKSNEQRLFMGFSMYDTARQIVQSAVRNQNPTITSDEMKKEIFLRFYGQQFSQAEKEKIAAQLIRSCKH